MMKAIVYTKYGSPDVLQLKEVEKPAPKDSEVLVKVQATSVNLSDWEFLQGKPLYARATGLRKPSKTILGSDIAGVVEAVGKSITQFLPGDAVFGDLLEYMGGFAEYVCAPEHRLARKPESMTFKEAAAIPQASVIALQGIRDKGQVQPGQTVLINGAGGGAGTFAIQLAKLFGAEVTAVDSAIKFDLMRSLGANHLIDYEQTDFTQNGQQYDLIIDVVAYRSAFAYKRALNPGGAYFIVGGSMSTLLQILLLGPLLKRDEGKQVGILPVHPNPQDLLSIAELFDAGKVIPVIDKTYPLDEVPQALQYLGDGRSQGKVVITIAHE